MLEKFDIIVSRIKHEVDNNQYSRTKIAVCFIGGPGSGKTTIGNEICTTFKFYLHSNDYIRRLLDEYNLTNSIFEENQKAVRYIAIEIHKYLCERGISFVMDANIMNNVDFISAEMKDYEYNFVLIKVDCQKEVAINRINERNRLNNQGEHSKADIEAYYRYLDNLKKVSISENLITATVDTTSGDIKEDLERVKALLNDIISKNNK